MASNTSCNSGRVKLVDPNNFSGFGSKDNIFVPLEDLNISVILKSFRKERTLLTGVDTGGISENIAQIDVNFIEGSELGGRKVLTSKFTDLTTVFDKDVINDETLGITSIDIEFNASMTPMITINFVDVRGSSIFQNEENILNNKGNKYTTFFQLPYPMFELEIKGFYGLPVKYCLHLYKFNSKFNAQNGNFEITATFVGYTFALMSDMLIGYLKAIPYTTIGKQRFDKYLEDTGRNVLTLNGLSKQISEINTKLKRESSDNPAAVQIDLLKDAVGKLESLKTRINKLGIRFDLNQDKKNFDYIVFKHVEDFSAENKTYLQESYISNVKTDIASYNETTPESFLLDENDFINIQIATNTNGGKLYKGITKSELKSDDNTNLSAKLGNPSETEITTIKQSILTHIEKNNKGLGDDESLDVFDMSLLNQKLSELIVTLNSKQDVEKKTLARDFADTVREELGFQPTVRPIIECFTAAIEVFAETIFTVSTSAIANADRTTELAKKFTGGDLNTSDIHNLYREKNEFFPWPDYREKEDNSSNTDGYYETVEGDNGNQNSSVYVEKYLGADGVLENPENVDEIVFIEELLEAFRQSYKDQQETIDQEEKEETTWFSINPFDSEIFIDKQPYERYEILNQEDIVRIMLIRAMTLLGYSYNPDFMSNEEILALAQIEVEAMINGVKDDKLKSAMLDVTVDTFKNVSGRINDDTASRNVVIEKNNEVEYVYMFKYKDDYLEQKLLPISDGFNSTSSVKAYWYNVNKTLIEKRDLEGSIFFTNYSSNMIEDSDGNVSGVEKPDDGGIYVRIFNIGDVELKKALPETGTQLTYESVFSLDKLKQEVTDKSAGYNVFGGGLGVQEFEKMDWGDSSLEGLPLMYVFYKDGQKGLALTRKASALADGKPANYHNGGDYSISKETISLLDENDRTSGYEHENGDMFTSNLFYHKNLGINRALFKQYLSGQADTISYPYVELTYDSDTSLPGWFSTKELEPYSPHSFSLFGSDLYYNQNSQAAKAYLFLQTLPFNFKWDTSNPLGQAEIKNLFRNSSGIVHAPRLWCAYIGGMFWRNLSEKPIKDDNGMQIGGGSGTNDPITFESLAKFGSSGLPNKDEYFPKVLDSFWEGDTISYDDIEDEDLINRLPMQIKYEFIKMFFHFVNGTDSGISWRTIADKLEIFEVNNNGLTTFIENIRLEKYFVPLTGIYLWRGASEFKRSFLFSQNSADLKVKKDVILTNYETITAVQPENVFGTLGDPFTADANDFHLFLELKDGSPAVITLLQALCEESLIFNSTYKVWTKNDDTKINKKRTPIKVKSDVFNSYFEAVIEALKNKKDSLDEEKKNQKIDLEIFGTTNTDAIKLQLYRTCKNIYDKWLGGAKDIDNLIFQCGGRSLVDEKLAKKYSNNQGEPKIRMIDSFRFVSRSFRDIGDQLYINPLPINEILLHNANSSSYDLISKTLSSNNFNFQPLPNFINFNDEKVMTSIFKPFSYIQDEIPQGACGPSFVCVYVGQTSKHLDYGAPERFADGHSSKYPNDGFDLRCNGSSISVESPKDFISGQYAEYEEPVSAFVVKYSQQNQNIFKDIQLDQSEFTETDESLQIQDELSQKGTEHNRAIVGQNIYNVYAVRSYTAKVEMMGNAMIQPMMYFQLDNIPMFHGAYMITKVSHSIRPHNMSTNFTGVRIRYPETRLIDSYDVYMELINTLEATGDSSGTINASGAIPKSSPPILQTLIDNGCSGSNINSGNIKPCKVEKIPGISFQLNPNKQMICEAVEPLTKMLTDWTKWMSSNGFKVIVDPFKLIVLMFELLDENVPAVTA